jgi:hypothetical protein
MGESVNAAHPRVISPEIIGSAASGWSGVSYPAECLATIGALPPSGPQTR